MELRVETTIRAHPAVVFGTMEDLAAWPGFIPGILRVEVLTAGPVGAGTRFRETRRMFGREATEEMTVAEWDPPRRMVLTAESRGTRYRAVHEVLPDPAGARLVLTFAGTPATWSARLLAPLALLAAPGLRKTLAADLDALKAEAERRTAATGPAGA